MKPGDVIIVKDKPVPPARLLLGLVLDEKKGDPGLCVADEFRVWFWESGHITERSVEFWKYNYRVVVGDEE